MGKIQKHGETQMSTQQTSHKSKRTKWIFSVLIFLSAALFAVGCGGKEIFKTDSKILDCPTVELLQNSSQLYSNSAKEIVSTGLIGGKQTNNISSQINDTYSGAIITGSISTLPDKPDGLYPSIQVWIDGSLEEFRIVKSEIQSNDAGEYKNLTNSEIANNENKISEGSKQTFPSQASVIIKGYYYYLTDSNGSVIDINRARLILDTNSSQESNQTPTTLRLIIHPNLTGSTKQVRTLRIKALATNGTAYKSSPYSVSVSLQVRHLTFEATSYNSTETNYGYLTYNPSIYQFSILNQRVINGISRLYKLEGYFIDGRVVKVTRHLIGSKPTSENENPISYDFQSWTISEKANLPNTVTQNNKIALESTDFCFDLSSLANSTNIFNITSSTENQLISAWDPSQKDNGYYQSSTTSNNFINENSIYVRASITTHNHTIYANYAKINNFKMYGRVFNGDEITESSTQMQGLPDVIIHIHKNKNKTIQFNGETITAETLSSEGYYEYNETLMTGINGDFTITNLSKDAYITLTYIGKGTEAPSKPDLVTENVKYQFVSKQFDIDSNGNTQTNGDGDKILSTKQQDQENISITGSALSAGSNLVVEVVLEGNIAQTDSIRYEIAQGITSETQYYTKEGTLCTNSSCTHENCIAYTATTVLVSIIPADDTMIVGYELSSNKTISNLKQIKILEEKLTNTPPIPTSNGQIAILIDNSNNEIYWIEIIDHGDSSYDEDRIFKWGEISYKTISKKLNYNSNEYENKYFDLQIISTENETTENETTENETTENETKPLEIKNAYAMSQSIATGNNLFIIETTEIAIQSVKATVYETEMKDKDGNSINVYYSLKTQKFEYSNANGEKTQVERLFYIDPVGYKSGEEIKWIAFGETENESLINNGTELINKKTIMLGCAIREDTDPQIIAFRNCIGASLRDDYYYYVKPINQNLKINGGDAISVYIRNEKITTTEKINQNSGLRKAEYLYLSGTDTPVYLLYDEETKAYSSGTIKSNDEIYFISPIGTYTIDERNERKVTTYFDIGLDYEVEDNNVIYKKDSKTIIANLNYLRSNSDSYETYLELLGIYSTNETDNTKTDLLFYVVPLDDVNSTDAVNNLTYTRMEQYYYAIKTEADATLTLNELQKNSEYKSAIILGKVIASTKGFSTYPNLLANAHKKVTYTDLTDLSAKIKTYFNSTLENETIGEKPMYVIDQTLKANEVEGFLGATYLSGTPYPNPVFKFTIYHTEETANVTLSINVDQIYYIEALGTLVERETSDVITDFSAFAFRDPQTNISASASQYIEKQSTLITKNGRYIVGLPYITGNAETGYILRYLTLPVEDFACYANDNNIYYIGSDSYILKFCATKDTIDNYTGAIKGKQFYTELKSGDQTLSYNSKAGTWTLNGLILNAGSINAIYTEEQATQLKNFFSKGINNAEKETIAQAKDYAVWSTSSSKIENIQYFDIHTYDSFILSETGELIYSSDCEDPCIGLLNLDNNEILAYENNYNEILVAGLTSMYRVSKTDVDLALNSKFHPGLYDGTALKINQSETTDAYFYLGNDAVALVAEPTHNIIVMGEGDITQSVRYRFKEWKIYERFNSEIIIEVNATKNNDFVFTTTNMPIMYFYANTPGYYLFLPVYERVYELAVATNTTDGSINKGGSASLSEISAGSNVSIEEANTYFIEMLTNEYQLEITRSITIKIDAGQDAIGLDNIYYQTEDCRTVDANGNEVNNEGLTSITLPVQISNKNTYVAILLYNTKAIAIEITGDGQLQALQSTYTAKDKYGNTYLVQESDGYLYTGNNLNKIVIAKKFEKNYYYYISNNVLEPNYQSSNNPTYLDPTTWLIDRHSKITIVANADNGYRLNGWTVTIYDEETKTYITSNIPLESDSATFADDISIPSNIQLLENEKYYDIIFRYENGRYFIEYQTSSYKSGNYILFGGRLYYSNSITNGNMVISLTDFIPLTGVSDDYIEYFYHHTSVEFEGTRTHELEGGTWSAGSYIYNDTKYSVNGIYQSSQPNSPEELILKIEDISTTNTSKAKLYTTVRKIGDKIVDIIDDKTVSKQITRLLITKDNEVAIHYVKTDNLLDTIISGTTGSNPIKGKQATEVFINEETELFYLNQNSHNPTTLIPTKVFQEDQSLRIIYNQSGEIESILIKEEIELKQGENAYLTISTETKEPQTLTINYNSIYAEDYQVNKTASGNYYITRYYLSYQDNTYSREVYNYDESAQIYDEHTYNEKKEVTTNALQTVFVDFLVGQISALNSQGQTMELTYEAEKDTTEGIDNTKYSAEIDEITLIINQISFITEDGKACTQAHNHKEAGCKAEFTIEASSNGITKSFVYDNTGNYTIIVGTKTLTITGIDYTTAENGTITNIYITRMANSYELSSTVVYENNGKFYRRRISGNIEVSGNTITINSLDDNYFVTALFTEYSQIMPYVEEGEDAQITVQGLFYFNPQDNSKAIRTIGTSATTDQEQGTIKLGQDLFYYEDTSGEKIYLAKNDIEQNYTYMQNSSKVYITNANKTQEVPFNQIENNLDNIYLSKTNAGEYYDKVLTGKSKGSKTTTTENITIYHYDNGNLIIEGDQNGYEAIFAESTNSYFITALLNDVGYSLYDQFDNPGYQVSPEIATNRWLKFDTGTSIIAVIRVSQGASLTAASLGLTNMGNLTYLMQPTDTHIKDKSTKFTFYVIRIDFDHKTDNTYLADLEHPDRKNQIEAELSTQKVYYDPETKEYYFNKIYQLNEEYGYKAKYEHKLSQIEKNYIAKVSANGATNYYYVPSGNLSDLAQAKWIDNSQTKSAQEISYRSSSKGILISSTAPEIISRLSTSSGYMDNGKTKIQINNGYINNYLNLTSIQIYQFNIFAVTLSQGESLNDDLIDRSYTDKNSDPIFYFGQQDYNLYTSGGRYVNGENLTYVGGIPSQDEHGTIQTTQINNRLFNIYNMSANGINSNSYTTVANSKKVLGPILFAIDSMVAVDLAYGSANTFIESNGKTYRFAGWYEQKKIDDQYSGDIKIGEIWSDVTYMGGSNLSHVSIADANTNIIALYKEVNEIKIVYNTNELTLSSNYSTDSLGDPWTYTFENGQTTASGYFDTDANLQVTLLPNAGYRLESVKASGSDSTNLINTKINLTLAQTICLPCATSNTYTITTQKLTTIVLKINNFDEYARDHMQLTVVGENSKTYFDSDWLNITNEESTYKIKLNDDVSLPSDTTNQTIDIYVSGKNIDKTEKNFSDTNFQIVFQVDVGNSVYFNYKKREPTTQLENVNPEFDGYYHNGTATKINKIETTAERMLDEIVGNVENIISYTMNTEVQYSNNGTSVPEGLKNAFDEYLQSLQKELTLSYKNYRYLKIDDRGYQTASDGESKQLLLNFNNGTNDHKISETFYFITNEIITISWDPGTNIFPIKYDGNTYNFVFVGYYKNNEEFLDNRTSLTYKLDTSVSVTLRFVLSSKINLNVSATTDENFAGNIAIENEIDAIKTTQDGEKYLIHGNSLTLITSSNSELAVKNWTIKISNQQTTISTPVLGKTNSIEFQIEGKKYTITYSTNQDLTQITLTISTENGKSESIAIECEFDEAYEIN